MASVDDFLSGVMPEAPDAPVDLVRQHLMRAAITLCKRALSWSVWLPPILLVEGQGEYELGLPADTELVIIRDVQIDNLPEGLPGLDLREVTRRFHDWRTHVSTPSCWVVPERGADNLRIVPAPGASSTPLYMHVRVALQPARAIRELPDWMASELFDELCAGAKATLLIIPGQSWSNPGLAGFYQGVFDEACGHERINIEMDQTTGSTRVAPRRFGR